MTPPADYVSQLEQFFYTTGLGKRIVVTSTDPDNDNVTVSRQVTNSTWISFDNWLEGEPCVNGWEGIWCCPWDLPYLEHRPGSSSSPNTDYWCSSNNDEDDGDVNEGVELLDFYSRKDAEWQPAGAGGCSAGTVTGTAADLAKCVVVRFHLPRNNLQNVMGESLGFLSTLIDLDVSENALEGPLPVFFTSRKWLSLKMSGNRFFYTESYGVAGADGSDDEISVAARGLIQHCKQGSSCSGVPPLSCEAFASYRCPRCFFVVETLNPDLCIKCDVNPTLPIMYMAGAGLLIVMAFAFYTWLINTYPAALRGGISTFSILYHHAQTVNIFAQLNLQWPPTVIAVIDALGINLFSIEIGRPECLIGKVDESMVGAAYPITASAPLIPACRALAPPSPR